MKKKVLILGGAGFIGLGITRFLGFNRNYDMVITDIISFGRKITSLMNTILKQIVFTRLK